MEKLLPVDLKGWAIIFDLDDTLYYEADYVASARGEIARRIVERYPDCGLGVDDMMSIMGRHPSHGPGAFDALYAALPPHVAEEATVDWMRRVYRSHIPEISLSPETEATLSVLKSRGAVLGIITDGRVETQSIKLHALGLTRFVDRRLISVSEAVGADKYSSLPFKRMEALTPGCTRRVYVGDNAAKDFIHPNAMGWHTVRMSHPESGGAFFAVDHDKYPPSHQAETVIDSLPELLCAEIADVRKKC